MQFRTIDFLNDYNIPYIDSHGMLTSAYVGFEVCPLCHHHNHGRVYAAMRRDSNTFTCWNCKSKDFYTAVQVLTGITDYGMLKDIFKKYGNSAYSHSSSPLSEQDKPRPTKIKIPGTSEMIPAARSYIENRGFSPEFLWEKYDLRATRYERPSYRIIIPITYNKRIISYTSRDYTNEQDLRVVSCKSDLEIINHKDLFLGLDYAQGKNALVVEGPWDHFRMGNGSLCSFGSEITLPQIMLLADKFENVFIMPDGGEAEPLKLAEETAVVLNSIGTNCEVIELHEEGDPDDLFRDDPDELIYLKKDLQIG
jgi:hypothetical protein